MSTSAGVDQSSGRGRSGLQGSRACYTNPRRVCGVLWSCPGRIPCGVRDWEACVGYNFLAVERDQVFLMPPSLTEWLEEDHLAWFVLDAVEEMNLTVFHADYRADGWGRAAHDPKMMVALMLYAYCVGMRSSRGDRAGLSGRCGVPGHHSQPGTGSHHDRPVPPAPRAGTGYGLHRVAAAVRAGRDGQGRTGRGGRDQDGLPGGIGRQPQQEPHR